MLLLPGSPSPRQGRWGAGGPASECAARFLLFDGCSCDDTFFLRDVTFFLFCCFVTTREIEYSLIFSGVSSHEIRKNNLVKKKCTAFPTETFSFSASKPQVFLKEAHSTALSKRLASFRSHCNVQPLRKAGYRPSFSRRTILAASLCFLFRAISLLQKIYLKSALMR